MDRVLLSEIVKSIQRLSLDEQLWLMEGLAQRIWQGSFT